MSGRLLSGCLVLAWVVACSPAANAPCADCAERDASLHDAGPERDAESSRDAAREASSGDAGEDALDAALDADQVDAEGLDADGLDAADAEPVILECTLASDCVLPPELLRCQTCQDGSQACPEVRCLDHLCATHTPRPCAEQRGSACTKDDDCARPACTLLCQGDGRSACLPPLCLEGACVPRFGTCGVQLEPCPEGTKPGRECGECTDAGECTFRVLGCFDACSGDAGCGESQACVDGLCQLVAGCAGR